ncbi:MAG: ATP-grasp domain-containing protein [Janthinobacterium lividum]
MLNLLFPSLPYSRTLDPMWQPEADEARRRGYSIGLYDAEQPKLYQQPVAGRPTLYRGWMLTAAEYQQLHQLTPLLVSPALYQASHRADGWYAALAPFTPASVLVPAAQALPVVENFLRQNGRCFVKSLSKSFGAASVVTSAAEFLALLQAQAIAPAEVLFVREFVALSAHPEERFFAVRGVAYGAAGRPFPSALLPALPHLQNRWLCTIDVAYSAVGEPLIIEVGDGQVSDIKEWEVADLYQAVLPVLAGRASSAQL